MMHAPSFVNARDEDHVWLGACKRVLRQCDEEQVLERSYDEAGGEAEAELRVVEGVLRQEEAGSAKDEAYYGSARRSRCPVVTAAPCGHPASAAPGSRPRG